MCSLTIAHLYPNLLNLYGDTGNVECLVQRCRWRGIRVSVVPIGVGELALRSSRPPAGGRRSEVGWRGIGVEVVEVGVGSDPASVDIIISGGGADLGQTIVAKDLQKKKAWLQELADSGVVGLFVCGAYQLLGKYYQAADGSRLEGVGIFDMYTQHFGNDKPRCVGNVVVEVPALRLKREIGSDPLKDNESLRDSALAGQNGVRPYVVGFENHGGRTYLNQSRSAGSQGLTLDSRREINPGTVPLGKVTKGWGNNGEDGTEGAVYKNFFGTYLHGPVLPKNPHLADLLIGLALERKYGSREDRVGPLGKRRVPGEPGPSRAKWGPTLLEPLDDELEWAAHKRARKTKQ